jgi:hypothetical protein
MKRVIPAVALFLGLGLGVAFHAPIMSLFDGTKEAQDWKSTPVGFLISPSEASFIIVNLKHRMHWGMCNASSVYVDSENYYVISPRDEFYRTHTTSRLSYYARLNGYCVNGKTGEVRRWDDWENKI